MAVSEMYLAKGNVNGSHYVLSIMDDGAVSLIWYLLESKVVEKDPIIKKSWDGSMRIEYGAPNLLGTRKSFSFTDKNGNLEPKWIKIK